MTESKSAPVDLNAGHRLIQHYESSWSAIHKETVDCRKKAENLTRFIQKSQKAWIKRSNKTDLLCKHFALLPDIVKEIDSALVAIGHVGVSLEETETDLYKYEDICEQLKLLRNIQTLKLDLDHFKSIKRLQLEQLQNIQEIKAEQLASTTEQQSAKDIDENRN